MDIDNLKELEKLMKLCRKQGIKTFKLGNVEFTLDDTTPAIQQQYARASQATASQEVDPGIFDPGQIPAPYMPTVAPDIIQTDMPTADQLLYGSSDPSVWEEEAKQ